DIYERTGKGETFQTTADLGALGDIYFTRGDYEKAEQYWQRKRGIEEKLLGPDHFHIASSIRRLGHVAYAMGDYTKAEALYQRCLQLSEKSLDPDTVRLAFPLYDLAFLYTTTGEFAKAEAAYQRALSILSLYNQRTGVSFPLADSVMFGMSRLYELKGFLPQAVTYQFKANELEERSLSLNLAFGSERQKLTILKTLSHRLFQNISLHARLMPNDDTARNLAVVSILQRKGRAQDDMSASLAALRQRFSAQDRASLDQLNDVTAKLSRLVLNGPQRTSAEEDQKSIKAFEEQRERLESEISRRSDGFYQRTRTITISDIQAAIPGDAALIEFAVYRPYRPEAANDETAYGEPRYIAYVIRRLGEVRWKDLGEAKTIDAAIDRWRQVLRDPKRGDVRQLGRAVDEEIMQPIRPLLGDSKQLLISPD